VSRLHHTRAGSLQEAEGSRRDGEPERTITLKTRTPQLFVPRTDKMIARLGAALWPFWMWLGEADPHR